jgi:hypothetical protein
MTIKTELPYARSNNNNYHLSTCQILVEDTAEPVEELPHYAELANCPHCH